VSDELAEPFGRYRHGLLGEHLCRFPANDNGGPEDARLGGSGGRCDDEGREHQIIGLQDHRVAEAALLVATCAAGRAQAPLAVNHLAPFLLTDLLARLLQATPSSRVGTVSSYMHTRVKDIPWDDLQAEHDYSAAATYNLTKLLNVLFTYELARRWAGTSVTANALHPGWPLKTNLGREQTAPSAVFDRATKLIGSSAAKGARTSLYLAGSPDVTAVTGQYFSRCRPAKSSALTHNTTAAERLWAHSAELCGLPAS